MKDASLFSIAMEVEVLLSKYSKELSADFRNAFLKSTYGGAILLLTMILQILQWSENEESTVQKARDLSNRLRDLRERVLSERNSYNNITLFREDPECDDVGELSATVCHDKNSSSTGKSHSRNARRTKKTRRAKSSTKL